MNEGAASAGHTSTSWMHVSGLETETGSESELEGRIRNLELAMTELRQQLNTTRRDDRVSIICFSGEWDKLFAALTLASGSLAMGKEVHLFFTFWAVAALRKKECLEAAGKTRLQSMFNRMLPCGPTRAPLSKLNFMGFGKVMMRKVMKQKGVDDLDILYDEVKELGAHIHLCDTSTELFGLNCRELDTGTRSDMCGVATFLGHAFKSQLVLFV